MKKYNFCSGPSMLPRDTVKATAEAILDFKNSSFSLLEISHRSKDFYAIMQDAIDLTRDLLNVPSGYSVLFMGVGASYHFCMVPFNLLNKKAAYLNTGRWANNAMNEAKVFGDVIEVASSKESIYNHIPKNFQIPHDADYFHITTNNTIYGTEFHNDIDSPIPLVADMSSDIFSRPVDVSKYGLIYAGAQKNLAPAGLSIVIVKDDLLGQVSRKIPTILDYRTHIESGSMFNTPPVMQVYAALQTLKWLKNKGGLQAMQKRNEQKANLLYEEIDRSSIFRATAAVEDRSLMNVCFVMNYGYEGYEEDFIRFAEDNGLYSIRGHRTAGGFRASIYNAMPLEGVEALTKAIKDFEKKIKK